MSYSRFVGQSKIRIEEILKIFAYLASFARDQNRKAQRSLRVLREIKKEQPGR